MAPTGRAGLSAWLTNATTPPCATCEQMDLPLDPDLPSHEGPCGVYLSSNAGHVAVCWPSGPVAVYEVALPPCLYDSGIVDRPPDAPPLDLSGGQLVLTLHFPLKVINSESATRVELCFWWSHLWLADDPSLAS